MACARGCCKTPREHYLSIRISADACPTRGAGRYRELRDMEKRWNEDIPAAQRLLKDGVEIKSVDGAAEVERKAQTKVEAEQATFFTERQRNQYNAVAETSNEHGASLPLAE